MQRHRGIRVGLDGVDLSRTRRKKMMIRRKRIIMRMMMWMRKMNMIMMKRMLKFCKCENG